MARMHEITLTDKKARKKKEDRRFLAPHLNQLMLFNIMAQHVEAAKSTVYCVCVVCVRVCVCTCASVRVCACVCVCCEWSAINGGA
jgi:hypothetical protein